MRPGRGGRILHGGAGSKPAPPRVPARPVRPVVQWSAKASVTRVGQSRLPEPLWATQTSGSVVAAQLNCDSSLARWVCESHSDGQTDR